MIQQKYKSIINSIKKKSNITMYNQQQPKPGAQFNNQHNREDNKQNQSKKDFNYQNERMRFENFQEQQYLNLQEMQTQPLLGFTIIGQDQTNQILQVNLYPKQKLYVRGKILYANFDWNSLTGNQFFGYDSFWDFCKECYETKMAPMRKIHNKSKYVNYFGLTKSNNRKSGGKFLVIDSDAYGNDIYINPNKVVLSNVSQQNSYIKGHPSLKSYINKIKKEKPKKKKEKQNKSTNQNSQESYLKNKDEVKIKLSPRTVSVLQSEGGNIFIEKYLGADEKLYANQKSIACLSGTVKVRKGLGGLQPSKIEGPGWVFLENSSSAGSIFNLSNKFFIILLVVIFIGLIQFLEHLGGNQ